MKWNENCELRVAEDLAMLHIVVLVMTDHAEGDEVDIQADQDDVFNAMCV